MSLAAAARAPRLWPAVGKLLRLRALIFFSGFRRAKTRRKIGLIFLALVVLGFLVFIFFVSRELLGFLRSPELVQAVGDMTPLLESVPVLVITGAFVGILLTSFGILLQALYLAGDMDFLLSTPVPLRAVFIAKLLQAILPNFSLICLFAVPVLFGLGTAAHYAWPYYPLVLALLAALAVAAAGLASVLVMAIVRVFPAQRIAEVLGFVGAVASLLCSQSGQLMQFRSTSANDASTLLRLLARVNTPWSPLAWSGRGLVAVGEGRWLTGLAFTGLTLVFAGLSFGLTLVLAERLYYTGWASLQNNRRRKAAPRAARRGAAGPLGALADRYVPAPVWAIVVKDARVLQRDLRNLSQMITPLILGIVYALALIRSGGSPPPGRGEAPAWFMEAFRNGLAFGNVAIALFVGWSFVGRLAGMAFSQEGKSYWMLKAAPISTRQLLAAKFSIAYLPALAVGWGFLLVIALLQRGAAATLWLAFPVVALCLAGATGINLAFGIQGANMNWENPRQMQRGVSGCLGALASFAYLLVALALFLVPAVGLALLGLPAIAGQLAGLALGGIFSLACTLLPPWLVRARVGRLGEG